MIQITITPVIIQGKPVQTIGNTTIAALIGAGGLGTFIFQGLSRGLDDLILPGALPILASAVIAEQWLSIKDK